MGLSITTAEVIVRENLRRAMTGSVFTIGRQTLFFTPEVALAILRNENVPCSLSPDEIPIETATIQSGAEHRFVDTNAFFRLIGIDRVSSLDHSDYEGADVIHDLNKPLPSELEGIADVIIDGSTLDNVWNPALALQNLCRMLKPGGRMISINMGSNHYGPYTILTSPWLFDYFVVNRFVDARIYMQVSKDDGPYNIFAVDPRHVSPNSAPVANLSSGYQMGLYAVVEKGENSTWDRTPIQQFYQSSEMRQEFAVNCAAVANNARPDVLFSSTQQFIDTPVGYRFVPPPAGMTQPNAPRRLWPRRVRRS